MHDQFCIKFPNHHFCICVMGIMWGIPFILEPNQTLTCIMSSHSTSLEPKSWLTIILTLGSKKRERRKISNQRVGESKKKRKKIPNQRMGESKRKERKLLIKDRKKSEEMCRKVFGSDNIWTVQNCHQMNKKKGKGNHNLKVVFSLWLPTKILCVGDFFAPH